MIDRDIFGKGEAALIDRRAESFPHRAAEPPGSTAAFQQYHDAFMREYFYILRKIFHTFAYDMKEFAIDFHEVGLDLFLRALTWLTYIQTIVYEMDIYVEREQVGAAPESAPDLGRVGQRIAGFLQEHDLLDAEILRCIKEVVAYLNKERLELRGKAEYSREEILSILALKSADLEILRRVLLRLFGIPADPDEMRVFKRIDQVREVFDDIRDYHEDLEIANFNTVIFLQKIGGDMNRGCELLRQFLGEEMGRIAMLVEEFEPRRREKFQAIFCRLEEETTYFLAELDAIPRA
jgi:hypothetical protein